MRRCYSILIVAGALGVFAAEPASAPAASEAAASHSATSFEAFKIVTQRNIFDPNRSAPGRSRSPREERRPARTDTFTLLGAMSYEKGSFAFFDGSSSEYRKSVKAGDTIAGYKVAAVTPTNVTLEAGEKKIELPVGAQMKRQDEGEWQMNAHPETFASSTSSSSSSSSNSSPSSSSNASKSEGSSEGMSEVLKRLLQRRQEGK